MKPQASPLRSPVTKGIYHVPVEYQFVLETTLRSIRVRSKDIDPQRRKRVTRVARKWALTTARAIKGEVKGWLEVYPQYVGSTWGSAAQMSADAAGALVAAITSETDDLAVSQHIEALIESLKGNTPTTN